MEYKYIRRLAKIRQYWVRMGLIKYVAKPYIRKVHG